MTKKRIAIILIIVATILLIPFIAMQFTSQVKWSLFDFVIMGFLLIFLGLTISLIQYKFIKPNQRVAIIIILIVVFVLLWAELAVGVFGTPIAGN